MLQLVMLLSWQPIVRFALDELVDEIDALNRPAVGSPVPGDLDLAHQVLFPYLVLIESLVGTVVHRNLVEDDSQSEVIDSKRMILHAHNLRGYNLISIDLYIRWCHLYHSGCFHG
jgi:hypothetical protein